MASHFRVHETKRPAKFRAATAQKKTPTRADVRIVVARMIELKAEMDFLVELLPSLGRMK